MDAVRVLERAVIGSSAAQAAHEMSKPESIARFPGIRRAFVGQPGVRLDITVDPMRLQDSMVLSWWKPHIEETHRVYPFGLEGGRWLSGTGRVQMDRIASEASDVSMSWEIDVAKPLAAIPGFNWAFGRWLRQSTITWLERMRLAIESRSRKEPCFTLADVGA